MRKVKVIKYQCADSFEESERSDVFIQAAVPCQFEYEVFWRFTFECLECKNTIDLNNKNNITDLRIKNLNSLYYSIDVLKQVTEIFNKYEIVKVEEVYYLNDKYFDYQYDMQRISGNPIYRCKCSRCDSSYMIDVIVGHPELPERDLPFGSLGLVKLLDIILVPEDLLEN